MAHFGDAVEQALHYLFRLGAPGQEAPPSSRDVADFYRAPSSSAAKLFTRLEKAGIVRAVEGREGGFVLARPLAGITLLAVVDAIEGRKPLFACKDIRARCEIFQGSPPPWATSGLCAIHAAMLEAERAMRDSLAATTLQDIRDRAGQTIPPDFGASAAQWFDARRKLRRRRHASTGTEETRDV